MKFIHFQLSYDGGFARRYSFSLYAVLNAVIVTLTTFLVMPKFQASDIIHDRKGYDYYIRDIIVNSQESDQNNEKQEDVIAMTELPGTATQGKGLYLIQLTQLKGNMSDI